MASKKQKPNLKSQKQPKISSGITPSDRQPRYEINPDSNRSKKPSWQIGFIDKDGQWSFFHINRRELWLEIISKLNYFETMTWQEILDASGGRSHGNNSHEIPVRELAAAARKRLKELSLDDYDSLFSLRLAGRKRIWGILEGSMLRLLWFDENHEVYPTGN